ncbi:MAG: hypothetical protein QME54_05140 [Actinomycetota bacterium]|nr:hypothetical protein [Actinomycetota bacterium]
MVKDKAQISRLTGALLVSAGLTSIYGIFQHLGIDPLSGLYSKGTELARSFSSLAMLCFLEDTSTPESMSREKL